MYKLSIVLIFCLLQTISFAIEGLSVGQKAPQLILNDLSGNSFNLLKQKRKTLLVFYRGSWCPYCMQQLKSIQAELVEQIGDRAQLVAISVDRVNVAKKMKKKFNFNFKIISDPKAVSLKAFNIVNKLDSVLVKKYKATYKIDVEGDSGEVHHMVAHPAVFIVNDGKIEFSDVNMDYKVRTNNKDILKALK